MKSDLPPLNSLVAFEATARWQSFTRAAEELGVSQGAVSRQVKLLEEFLGMTLFKRSKPLLALTDAGQQYYDAISLPLSRIADATSEVRSRPQERLTIVTTNALAAFWLLPRFSRYQEEKDQDVRILAVDSIDELDEIDFDLGIYYCRTPPSAYRATPLFEERVFPVCSPSFLETHPAISDPVRLAETTLLDLDSQEDWIGWQDWFASSEITNWGQRTITLNSYPLVIQAALNGQGVALAWQTLVDDYLDSGLLVTPTDQSLATQSRFYLLEPAVPDPGRRDMIQDLSSWLLNETGI